MVLILPFGVIGGYIQVTLGFLLSQAGVPVDRTAALLRVTDRPSRLARVEQYLDAVMQRVTRDLDLEDSRLDV